MIAEEKTVRNINQLERFNTAVAYYFTAPSFNPTTVVVLTSLPFSEIKRVHPWRCLMDLPKERLIVTVSWRSPGKGLATV